MNPNNLSIGYIASAVGGAGITQIATDFVHSLILIGISVVLLVMVAVLNRFDIPVSAAPLG